MKKTIVAVALVLIFVLALAAPAFAQTMVHVGVVKVNGMVWSNKQVGHFCNTGAEQTKTIRGNGELTNDFSIAMVSGKLTVVDKNDFVSAAGTAAPLVITSEIRLCTPPKMTYKLGTKEAPVGLPAIYNPLGAGMPAYWTLQADGSFGWTGTTWKWDAAANGWKGLTTQTWAALVRADAGFSGNLHQDFEAAYGAYSGTKLATAEATMGATASNWSWNFAATAPAVGGRFVGDYFKMKQTARTSMGFVGRYIDMSSPWSGALLYEDTEFTGFSETVETFNMTNALAGSEIPGKWWTGLFTRR